MLSFCFFYLLLYFFIASAVCAAVRSVITNSTLAKIAIICDWCCEKVPFCFVSISFRHLCRQYWAFKSNRAVIMWTALQWGVRMCPLGFIFGQRMKFRMRHEFWDKKWKWLSHIQGSFVSFPIKVGIKATTLKASFVLRCKRQNKWICSDGGA